MNVLNEVAAAGLLAWLADFYLLATLLMLVALAARRWIRQPVQRLTVHWVVAVELAALAVVCTLPFRPRISLLAAAAQKSPVESPVPATAEPMSMPAPMPRTTLPRMSRAASLPDVPLPPDVPESAAPLPPPVPPQPRWSWTELVTAAYLASAGLVVAWLAWGAAAAMRACRSQRRAGAVASRTGADRRRWPPRSAAAGQFAGRDRRGPGPAPPDDRAPCRAGPRGSAGRAARS